MGMAERRQPHVGVEHGRRDPGAVLPGPRRRAFPHHLREDLIARQPEAAGRAVLRSERDTLASSVYSTMRGSGLHHSTGSSSLNHGKMPRA
jgi:hypothetical protein